jgi:predicted nicotinamide N-methyase
MYTLLLLVQKRFGAQGLEGARVCDIGSGTGFTGIIAAALGAKEATLTDQTTVQALLEENILLNAKQVSPDVVKFAEFDWDASPAHLNPPFDLILVSDCVLPKLYPIEPLVKVTRVLILLLLLF